MEVLDETGTVGLGTENETVGSAIEPEQPESERLLVKRIQKTIIADKKHHEGAFNKMRESMFVAQHGRKKDYPETSYVANIVGRHIQQKTAALYAKNPKAVARRRETLDFQVWDENPASLQQAMMALQMAQQAMAATPEVADPATGEPIPVEPIIPPEMQQAFEQAQAVIADFAQGMERRKQIGKIGKTLEILFAQALREQKPVDFKTAAKQLVRRACTTGVGYCELGFQREMGPRPEMTEKLADARARLDHLQRLMEEAQEGEFDENDPEAAELQASIEALQSEPEIVLREGLVFDFPQSTKVIPDKLCQNLVGFVGARHLTIEYLFKPEEVREMFGVDLKTERYKGYSADGTSTEDASEANTVPMDDDEEVLATSNTGSSQGLVCVWKHYDKTSGLVYLVADGYPKWLRAPAAPDVFVEDFWPVYALTFNAVENETSLFPPSDVTLMLDQQMEYNRSRQGMREHRTAARPRWAYANGALEDQDMDALETAKPFSSTAVNLPQGSKVGDILQPIPVPGVDPNLYETGQYFNDLQLTVGVAEARLGGLSKATATESAISAGSTAAGDSSSIDDLDAFLTMIARASGQVLLREMSPEKVMEIAGPGAVWPQMTLADIAAELFLEVEAGSTGKPNQAVELQAWERILPFMIQMPGLDPTWLLRETIRRLDDRMDVTEAITEGMPSIIMQNAMQQPAPADPGANPNAQGAEGAQNGPPPPGGPSGTGPAFGSNQT